MVGQVFSHGMFPGIQQLGLGAGKMLHNTQAVNIAEILSMSGQRSHLSCSFMSEEIQRGQKIKVKWNNINDYYRHQYDTFHRNWRNHPDPAWRNSRGNWYAVNESVMRKAMTAAFLQDPAARERLLATGDRLLIADGKGPHDRFWGDQNGRGENKLGHILMDLRERLRPEKAILFYDKNGPYYEFTNFYPASFKASVKKGGPLYTWPTSEHYFQARKFAHLNRPDIIQHIASLPTSRAAFEFAKSPENKKFIHPNWHQGESERAMLDALSGKFNQNSALKQKLLDTREKELIENSPVDPHWGVGLDGTGHNKLGKLLMHLREEYLLGKCKKAPRELPINYKRLWEPWDINSRHASKAVHSPSIAPSYYSAASLPPVWNSSGVSSSYYHTSVGNNNPGQYLNVETADLSYRKKPSKSAGQKRKCFLNILPDFIKKRKSAVTPGG